MCLACVLGGFSGEAEARIVVWSLVEFWNRPVNLRVSYVRICANWRVGELGWCAQDWDAVTRVAANELCHWCAGSVRMLSLQWRKQYASETNETSRQTYAVSGTCTLQCRIQMGFTCDRAWGQRASQHACCDHISACNVL